MNRLISSARTDRLLGENSPTLAYGGTMTVAEITCDSELSGMTCKGTPAPATSFSCRATPIN